MTSANAPQVTVDNVAVAQFVYLLLHNEKIPDIIDTVGRKGVLSGTDRRQTRVSEA